MKPPWTICVKVRNVALAVRRVWPSALHANQYPAIRHHSSTAALFARAQIFLKAARSKDRRPDPQPADGHCICRTAASRRTAAGCLQRLRVHRPRPADPVFRRIRFTWHCFVPVGGAVEPRATHASDRHFMTCRGASPMAGAQIFLKSGSKQDIRHEMAQRSLPCDSRMRGAVVPAPSTDNPQCLHAMQAGRRPTRAIGLPVACRIQQGTVPDDRAMFRQPRYARL